ncbi:MAG TPA: helix-turn-helix transcriptional regulator [Gaiellaceae bacterium]|nr:helix-turn-helix transcriptional regulator [Gaiellaceae bacterium]
MARATAVDRVLRDERAPDEIATALLEAFLVCLDADGGCVHLTDPASGVPIGGSSLGETAGSFEQSIDFEYRRPDALRFRDLAHRSGRTAALGIETGGELHRSARYVEMIEPSGGGDELRVSFGDSFGTWATLVAFRRRPFATADVEFVAGTVDGVSASLRRGWAAGTGSVETDAAPVVLVLDAADRLVSTDAVGKERFADLGGTPGTLPQPFFVVAAEAREGRAGRAIARGSSGAWHTIEASRLDDEPYGAVAVVVRPASAQSLADLIFRAFGLSAREREVARYALEGRSAKAIAGELVLSPYTVEDHLKRIYDKTGARSREGLAQLART